MTSGRMFWFFFLVLHLAESQAQPANTAVVHQEITAFLDTIGPAENIRFLFPAGALDSTATDSNSTLQLRFSSPAISYTKADSQQINRRIVIPVLIQQDSSATRQEIIYQDLLTYRQFRAINRESPDYLQGNDPTIRGKWLMPMLVIAIGTGINVGLFYLRSR